jgi:curved DNA-binding protein CbpA
MDSIIELTDFFDALEVDIFATLDDLKSAYKQFARKHHPDKNASGEEEFKQITAIRGALESKDDNISHIQQLYTNLLKSKKSKLNLAVEGLKTKFTFQSKMYIHHVNYIFKNVNQKDSIQLHVPPVPSIVKLVLFYIRSLRGKYPKYIDGILDILRNGTDNDKMEMIIKIIDYCDILGLELKDVNNDVASVVEHLYNEKSSVLSQELLNEVKKKREDVIGLSTQDFNKYININNNNIDFFIKVFKVKYDYKSETYVRMENLIEEELYYLSSDKQRTSTQNVPFFCKLLIYYLSSLKTKAKNDILVDLSENFSPTETFNEKKLQLQQPSFSSSSSSQNVLPIVEPKEPLPLKCKENTTKYYGKGQCLNANSFLLAVKDTLEKSKGIDKELERGMREIVRSSNGKIKNSPMIQELMNSGLLSKESYLFLSSLLETPSVSRKKESFTKKSSSDSCPAGYTRIYTKDNVLRCVSLNTFLKTMEENMDETKLLKGLKEIANPKIPNSQRLQRILKKEFSSPDLKHEVEKLIIYDSHSSTQKRSSPTKSFSSSKKNAACKSLKNKRVNGICRELYSALDEIRKQIQQGANVEEQYEKILHILTIFSEDDRTKQIDYLKVVGDLAKLYPVEKRVAILAKMRPKKGKQSLNQTLKKTASNDRRNTHPSTLTNSSSKQETPCPIQGNKRINGVCRQLYSALDEIRKQIQQGVNVEEQYEKILHILTIFSEDDRTKQIDYLKVVGDLAKLYPGEKRAAILSKMRPKKGKGKGIKSKQTVKNKNRDDDVDDENTYEGEEIDLGSMDRWRLKNKFLR